MGTSQNRASQTRAAIVAAATRLFQEHGYDATGIADIMGTIGLTNGGFYKHFKSKACLAAEVTRELFEVTRKHWEETLQEGNGSLETLLDDYLRLDNVDGILDPRALGCGLSGDPEREAIRTAFGQGTGVLAEILARAHFSSAGDGATDRGMSALATMMGALAIARGMSDHSAAQRLLLAARTQIILLYVGLRLFSIEHA